MSELEKLNIILEESVNEAFDAMGDEVNKMSLFCTVEYEKIIAAKDKEIEEREIVRKSHIAWINEHERTIVELKAVIEGLEARIDRIKFYVTHEDNCPEIITYAKNGECTCGLEQALSEEQDKHKWECVNSGMYDSEYQCQKCGKRNFWSVDNLVSENPEFGCKALSEEQEKE